jgi:KDO2-lipid IV(A) lauroyltransferase
MKLLSKIKLYAEYAGAQAAIFAMRLAPYGAASKFGYGAGVLLTKIIRKRFLRSVVDIQKAFPEKSYQEAVSTAKESWGNMLCTATEFCSASSMKPQDIVKLVDFKNSSELFEHLQSGKGAVLHLGHFGNWEVFSLFAQLTIRKGAIITRPMANPLVDKTVGKMRSKFGAKVISAYNNPLFRTLKALKSGYAVAILNDQSTPSSKIYMNFMGRPAEVGPMTAMLALKTRLPVFPIKITRDALGRVKAYAEPAIYAQEKYSTQSVVKFTKKLYSYYERWIKENPQNWMWMHNRWKRENETIAAMRKKGINE